MPLGDGYSRLAIARELPARAIGDGGELEFVRHGGRGVGRWVKTIEASSGRSESKVHHLEVGGHAMNTLRRLLTAVWKSDSGATATEYAVMLGVIVIAAIISLGSFGVRMNAIYSAIAGAVVPIG